MYLVIPEYRTEEIVYKTPKCGISYIYSVLEKLDETPLEQWTAEHLEAWTTHICVYADQRIKNFKYERRRARLMQECPTFASTRRAHKNSPAGRVRARALRNERLKHATPAWADKKQMQWFYDEAQRRELETGVKWHVDHAVPLCGKNVCGLNTQANLTLLPRTVNLKKGRTHASD